MTRLLGRLRRRHHVGAERLDLGGLQLRGFPRRRLRGQPPHGAGPVPQDPHQGGPGYFQGPRSIALTAIGQRRWRQRDVTQPSIPRRITPVVTRDTRACGRSSGGYESSGRFICSRVSASRPKRSSLAMRSLRFGVSTPEGVLDALAVRGALMAGLPGVMTWILLGALMSIFPARRQKPACSSSSSPHGSCWCGRRPTSWDCSTASSCQDCSL